MAMNTVYVDELLREKQQVDISPQDFFISPQPPKKQYQSRMNRDFVDSLIAGETKEVQENKAAMAPVMQPPPEPELEPLLKPEQYQVARPYDPAEPPIAGETFKAGAVERGAMAAARATGLLKVLPIKEAGLAGGAAVPSPDELKTMAWYKKIPEAVGWTGVQIGELAAMHGILKGVGIIGRMPKHPTIWNKAAEMARWFGGTEAIRQGGKLIGETITQQPMGYKPQEILKGAALGYLFSLGLSGAGAVARKLFKPSEMKLALRVLKLKPNPTQEQVAAAVGDLPRRHAIGELTEKDLKIIKGLHARWLAKQPDIVYAKARAKATKATKLLGGAPEPPARAIVTPTPEPPAVAPKAKVPAEPTKPPPKPTGAVTEEKKAATEGEKLGRLAQATPTSGLSIPEYTRLTRAAPDTSEAAAKLESKQFTQTLQEKIGELPEKKKKYAPLTFKKHVEDTEAFMRTELTKQPDVQDIYGQWGSATSYYLTVENREGEQLEIRISDHPESYGGVDISLDAEDSVKKNLQIAEYHIEKEWGKVTTPLKPAYELTKAEYHKRTPQINIEFHKEIIQRAIKEGKPVPREVLEEYKSEKWAKEALAKPAEKGEAEYGREKEKGLVRGEPQGQEPGRPVQVEKGGEQPSKRSRVLQKQGVKVTQQGQVDSQLEGATGKTELFKNKKGDILITEEHALGLSRVVIDKQANIKSLGSGPVDTKVWKPAKPQKKAKKPGRPLKELGGMPEQAPGLTKAEVEHLGRREQGALRAGQKRGYPIGYKAGARWEIDKARSKLNQIRMAKLFEEQNRKEAVQIVQDYVPKEKQGSYIKRILAAKNPDRIRKLTEAIDKYLDKTEHRQAISRFRNFIKETRSKYRRGEVELGKLRSDVRDTLLEVLRKYDVSKLSEAKREQLESRQDYIKNVSGTVADALQSLEEDGADILQMPNARIKELERLSKTHIGELDADQIRFIQASLEHLLAIASRKGNIKERIRAEKVRGLVHTARGEVSQRVKETGIITEKQGPGAFAGKLLTTAQATIRTLVGMFTGKDNNASVELITNRLYQGHEKKTAKAKELVLGARKEIANAGLDSKAFRVLDKTIKITLGGKNFTIDLDGLLSIYQSIRAEGNLRQLLKTKGLVITVYERDPSRLYVITKKTEIMTGQPRLSELRKVIEVAENKFPALKKMSGAYFDSNYKYHRPAINEVSMEYQNYELAQKKRYWHQPRAMPKRVEGTATDISRSIENQGRYLEKRGGTERLRIIPFRQEWINSIQSDATYYGMTLPMRDLRALVGDRTWQDKMRKAGRGRELDALITMLRRVQGHATDQSFIDATGAKILSNFGKSVLSLRLSGYGVQTASIPAAFEVIEPKYFHGLRNIARLPKIPIAAVKEMMDLSPRLWMRWTARQFDFVTGGAAAQNAFDTLIFEASTITEKGVKHYTWGDQKAIYHIYIAAQNTVAAETGLKRGTSEFKKRAIKLVEKALETQPQWDMIFRSALTSSPNIFLRGSTMFMSARNAQYNVLLRALDDCKKKRISSTTFGKRVSGVLYANTLVALVKRMVRLGVKAAALGLIYHIASEDEEKKQKVKLAARAEVGKVKGQLPMDAALNLVSLPAFGSIAQNIAYAAIRRYKYNYPTQRLQDIRTGNIFADLSLDATGTVADTAQLGKNLVTGDKFKSGPDKGRPKWHRDAKQVANGIAELLAIAAGLPYSAPRGEVYYQVKSAGTVVKKTKLPSKKGIAFKRVELAKRD